MHNKMIFSEEDYLNISGIQHFVFCRRQWALIHIEKQWAENFLTTNGELMHSKAHDNSSFEKRKDVIISRGMPVKSKSLGLLGVCDVVELHKSDDGAVISGFEGLYKIVPIEYKHGEPKEDDSDILQVAAQAVCLEDMFCTKVEKLIIYYGKTHHRLSVDFDDEIRNRLKSVVKEMHMLFDKQYTPNVKPRKQCKSCSLCDLCMPYLYRNSSVKNYIQCIIGDE